MEIQHFGSYHQQQDSYYLEASEVFFFPHHQHLNLEVMSDFLMLVLALIIVVAMELAFEVSGIAVVENE